MSSLNPYLYKEVLTEVSIKYSGPEKFDSLRGKDGLETPIALKPTYM